MATDNTKILVDQLNFDNIKQNIKTFLSGQSQFKDYDFEGSNLSVLIDLLAYNTYYNNIYNNMAVNEMFLDSASKRNSVVSIAKSLGYQPKSTRSAAAVVNFNISFPGSNVTQEQLIIPKYTRFTSFINDTSFSFVNLDERIAFKNTSGTFDFNGVKIVEGKVATEKYVAGTGVLFSINNRFCDTSTLKVYVNDNSGTGDYVVFNLADNISSVGPTSRVYFLKEVQDGLYEIEFGNGSIGVAIPNGSLVTLEYVVSSGESPNGCKTFKPELGSAAPGASVRITTVSSAVGGAEAESIEDIKFNAPRAYFSQNRAVTENDYQNVIFTNFDNARSISVWGGEKNDPPVYGKVFVSVVPKTGLFLNADEKTAVSNIIKSKGMVTTQHDIIDPNYLKIEIDTTIYYNPKATVRSASTIVDIVKKTIADYNDRDLKKFGGIFRQSKLSRLIDSSEKSIQSNITTIKLRREVEPKFNTPSKYSVNIGNPIHQENAFISTGFYLESAPDTVFYLRDSGDGTIEMFYVDGSEYIYRSNVGTTDYAKGIITINGLNISAVEGTAFEFIIRPESYDVVGKKNQILDIPASLVTINAVVDTVSSGTGTNSYVFTSSRS